MIRRASGAALVAVLTLAIWHGVLVAPFHYDDFANVVLDEATRDAGAFRDRLAVGVRPLTRASHFVDHALWGFDPRGHHLGNLALHVATVLGVWALARRRLEGDLGPTLAAAVFAVQPAHAEVVAYVSGRATGLMTALLVAALVAHERARRAPAWHAASAALAFAACLAKEVALVFPLLLAIWEMGRPRDAARRRALACALALALATTALLACSPRYRALLGHSLDLRTPFEALAVGLCAVPVLVSLWLRPWALSIDHALPRVDALAIAAGAAVVVAALAAAVATRRRAPLLALAILWALAALAPTSTFVARADPIAEKALYLAWIGPALALGALARSRRRLILTCAFVAAAAVAAAARVRTWQDPKALWMDAVAKAPESARAWNNLGMAHLAHREHGRARDAFLRATRLDPTDEVARANLARASLVCCD
jgi:hypothetical protein